MIYDLTLDFVLRNNLMKITSKFIAPLSLIAALGTGFGLMDVGRSQVAPLSPLPQQLFQTLAQTPPPTIRPDLALLARASTLFLQHDRYQTESILQLKGNSSGVDFTVNAQINTIAQAGNQFRSEISFIQNGQPAAQKSLIVSNGKQVWIYRPDLQQYMVSSYATFDKSDDTLFIGLSSLLFLQFPQETRKQIADGALSDDQVLQNVGLPPSIRGAKHTLEGQEVFTYEYSDKQEGYTLTAAIEPQTASLKQLQIAGQSGGTNFVVIEQVLQRTPNPVISDVTFRFTPPKGARQVKALSVMPF